ncbi:MAG: Hpt domain-containing protein [Nitrospirae bacterium]|nr:Hpt domain-containing protein [Nitrospirota bacterium]
MDYPELIRDYLDDAGGHLDMLDASLLSLERSGYNADIIRNMLGSLHTLKGNSGMMGFESLQRYVHTVEESLKEALDKGTASDDLIDRLFGAVNVTRKALQEIEKNPTAPPDLTGKGSAAGGLAPDGQSGQGRQENELSWRLRGKTETIKVDFTRLDDLLNLAGELVILRTRLNRIGERTRAEIATKSLRNEFKESLELMGKTIAGLQEGIMRVRMLPEGHVFRKFPRMARDLSKALRKEVRLVCEGEETEVDKTVIDAL